MINEKTSTDEPQGLREKLSPLVAEYTKKLIIELDDKKVFEPNHQTPKMYKLRSTFGEKDVQTQEISTTSTTTTTTTAPLIIPKQKDIVEDLTEFRIIINNIYYNLFPSDQNRRPTYEQMFYKLRDNKIINLNWTSEKELLDFLDNMDSLSNDDKAKKIAQQVLDLNKVNLNKLEQTIIENYAKEKLIRFFTDKGYTLEIQKRLSKNNVDVILINNNPDKPNLYFEIKFKRANHVPDKKVILQALHTLDEEKARFRRYYFILVFTLENAANFTKSRFYFNNSLRQVKGYDSYKADCRFIPISLTNLSLVEDAFHEFSREYLHQAFQMRFLQQEAPQGFRDRNDHILEQNFEFKKLGFSITIKPQDTEYWRFGFTFSKTDSFPRISEGRHGDKNYVFVHLCVGDLKGDTWTDANILKLNVYPDGFPYKNDFPQLTNYEGTEIKFTMHSNEDGTNVIFSAYTNEKSIGEAHIDLSSFVYCRLAAWCDYRPFDLDTFIDINHK